MLLSKLEAIGSSQADVGLTLEAIEEISLTLSSTPLLLLISLMNFHKLLFSGSFGVHSALDGPESAILVRATLSASPLSHLGWVHEMQGCREMGGNEEKGEAEMKLFANEVKGNAVTNSPPTPPIRNEANVNSVLQPSRFRLLSMNARRAQSLLVSADLECEDLHCNPPKAVRTPQGNPDRTGKRDRAGEN